MSAFTHFISVVFLYFILMLYFFKHSLAQEFPSGLIKVYLILCILTIQFHTKCVIFSNYIDKGCTILHGY